MVCTVLHVQHSLCQQLCCDTAKTQAKIQKNVNVHALVWMANAPARWWARLVVHVGHDFAEADGDGGGHHVIHRQRAEGQRHRVGAVEPCKGAD